jgi:hypothetical protein
MPAASRKKPEAHFPLPPSISSRLQMNCHMALACGRKASINSPPKFNIQHSKFKLTFAAFKK